MTEAPVCAQCGITGRAGAAFCAACGSALPKPEDTRTGTVIAPTPEFVQEPVVPAAVATTWPEQTPQADVAPASNVVPDNAAETSPTTNDKQKNSVLGWFVVATLVLAGFTLNLTTLAENPVVAIVCVILIIGLIVKRIRSGSFGKGWLTATIILGLLMFFGAVGQLSNEPGTNTGGGLAMWLPAALALIARIRVKDEG